MKQGTITIVKLYLLVFIFISFGFTQSTPELVDDSFTFTEGPVWKDGVLYFSDIKEGKIFKWSADSGTTVYYVPTEPSNGLALDAENNIIIAGHGARHIARLENRDSITILASEYNGEKFNSPNDIVVKSDGSIWFTDPT
ncbi:MAG TPA: SMP-30/gluconolactonase/LRE family protein, partial [Caldithrix sp.]|nr:SMP-30/gluconolactonase/LRE family protein [Caldithrix sp.]